MANISAVIIPAKILKDGRHKVRISISHNGGVRYIITDIIIDSENEFRNGRIVKRSDAAYLNSKLRKILQHYQDAIDSLDYYAGLTASELVQLITDSANQSRRTLLSVFEEYVNHIVQTDGSKVAYKRRFERISAKIPSKTIMNSMTRPTILGFAL